MADSAEDSSSSHFELLCGITLAIFAAALAINDLGAGKFGGDELLLNGQAQEAYAWYAAKGLKENLAEGQVALLQSLVDAGSVTPEKAAGLEDNIAHLTAEIARYEREKKEILLGSAVVGKDNWVQDIDGEFGVVIGAKEYEATANALGDACDLFDLGTLFLQLCLVIGAISLILKSSQQKHFFYGACVVLGVLGTFFAVFAYIAALAAA